jgi:hypothetical protein
VLAPSWDPCSWVWKPCAFSKHDVSRFRLGGAANARTREPGRRYHNAVVAKANSAWAEPSWLPTIELHTSRVVLPRSGRWDLTGY